MLLPVSAYFFRCLLACLKIPRPRGRAGSIPAPGTSLRSSSPTIPPGFRSYGWTCHSSLLIADDTAWISELRLDMPFFAPHHRRNRMDFGATAGHAGDQHKGIVDRVGGISAFSPGDHDRLLDVTPTRPAVSASVRRGTPAAWRGCTASATPRRSHSPRSVTPRLLCRTRSQG